MNLIFDIIADGRKVGITTAPSECSALGQATRALSRPTQSKDSESCDYTLVHVMPQAAASTPASAAIRQRQLRAAA